MDLDSTARAIFFSTPLPPSLIQVSSQIIRIARVEFGSDRSGDPGRLQHGTG
jgi:hypothetical protein